MMIFHKSVIGLFITFVYLVTLPAFAQHLPEGTYHTNREREYDLLHVKAELSFQMEAKAVSGVATLTATPLHPLTIFSVDAYRLNVEGVFLLQGDMLRSLPFSQNEEILDIRLPRQYSLSDTFTVSIHYTAQPSAGMYFQPDPAHSGQYFIYTYGEGGLHANWLPIYNDVNDKFTTEMIITVPLPYTAISNGALVSMEEIAGGKQIVHWKQSLPHANYLISLYVGIFDKGELPAAQTGTPLHFWVPRGKVKEGAHVFRNTPAMVDFFSQRFQYSYPWEKYDQIAVPDYAIGAMEHTSVTGHRASVLRDPDQLAPDNFGPDLAHYYNIWTADGTISHELAHHWFGDNTTCRNLSTIWLNESFATYLQMLWDEHSLGTEQLLLDRQSALDRYLEYVKREHIIRPLEYHYFDAVNDIFNEEHTYLKGAIVLHMLRFILGDEAFFTACSYFLHQHEFANVESHDFKIAIEEATGKNLDWFFDDWIYGGGHPVFEVNYQYLPTQRLIELSVEQIQPIIEGQDLFSLPVEITLVTGTGVRRDTIWVENREERYWLPLSEKPLLVSFDGSGKLVAEVHFKKSREELLYQATHDDLPGRVWAIRELAERFPAHPRTIEKLKQIITGKEHWWIKAEATQLLGKIATRAAEKVVRQALRQEDYHIRKAAVLTLPNFHPAFAEKTLRSVINKDSHSDVAAAAIISLAKVDGNRQIDFIRRQLNRPAWYDEINLACMKAFEIIGNGQLAEVIAPYSQFPYNQHVRNAALSAWASCAPQDERLHETLKNFARHAPYGVQLHAIELLGQIPVASAEEVLTKIMMEHGDPDFRLTAEQALLEIEQAGVLDADSEE